MLSSTVCSLRGSKHPDADVRGRVMIHRERTVIQVTMHLDGLVADELSRRELDPAPFEHDPCAVCSIAELEGLLVACREHSVDQVLSAKQGHEHR